MPGIVEPPRVVQDAVNAFGDLFGCEPARRHFAEYLTGLMIAERKTVLGIHREFAQISDQSCLNRFITEGEKKGSELFYLAHLSKIVLTRFPSVFRHVFRHAFCVLTRFPSGTSAAVVLSGGGYPSCVEKCGALEWRVNIPQS